jgi:hypothetical protein
VSGPKTNSQLCKFKREAPKHEGKIPDKVQQA